MKVTMQIRAEECHGCKKLMIQKAPYGVFPYYFIETQEAQAKELGLEFISGLEFNYKKYCKTCIDNGRAEFKCFSCEENKATSEIHFSVGDPAEFICSECYETLTAKEYDAKKEALEQSHRWDYE